MIFNNYSTLPQAILLKLNVCETEMEQISLSHFFFPLSATEQWVKEVSVLCQGEERVRDRAIQQKEGKQEQDG